MKTYKHEASGAELAREIAQPHVSSFGEVFDSWEPHNFNIKSKFQPRTITAQNVAGNLYKNVKAIFENKPEKKHADETMRVGPFCSMRDGHAFNVSCCDWVLSRIRERTIIIGDDRMSFEIVNHDNGWSLIIANHGQILGSVWLAYIKTDTIPKIKEFEFSFTGKQVGSIGSFCKFKRSVYAVDEKAARLALYDTHEHLSKIQLLNA